MKEMRCLSLTGILDQINKPNDIKNINPKDYRRLAKEIRSFLVANISKTGDIWHLI